MTELLLRSLFLAATNPMQSQAVASSTGRIFAVSLGIVCAIIAIGLLVVSRSRWGQNKPFTNCIVLAVLAHVWLLMYAYGTRIVTVGVPGAGQGTNQSYSNNSSIEWLDVPTEPFEEMPDPSETPLVAPSLMVTPPALLAAQLETTLPPNVEDTSDESQPDQNNPLKVASKGPSEDQLSPELVEELLREPAQSDSNTFENTQLGQHARAEKNSGDPITIQDVPSQTIISAGEQGGQQIAAEEPNSRSYLNPSDTNPAPLQTSAAVARQVRQQVPDSYQLRFADSRLAAASQFGGDASTEASVEAALQWLARNQEMDGSWNASKHGAGRETRTLERDRAGTGAKADTAMTGLSLLAFLGAGYTHNEGSYKSTVEAGLVFLLNSQMPSGDLAGLKQIGNTSDVYYARMYSHGMAALALAEAYALTGDRRLVEPIQKALGYTLQAQNRRTGGWRYQAFSVDDPGDTSQFGWQAMALLSSQNGGFTLPSDATPRMHGYLSRVSVGRHGGLAVYRPIPGQQPTRAMTAEALALRFMLKQPTSAEAISEAKQFLLQELPGTGEENLYYWYYASIALFQLQDEAWPIWNQAMKSQLLGTQIVNGSDTGSWDPTCIWAGYGGRIYSTATSCLCLEVYYRYLPIYRAQSLASSSQSELKR